jgi:hypothetical protein
MAGALHDPKTVARYYARQDGKSIARDAHNVFENYIAPLVKTYHEHSTARTSHYSLLLCAVKATIESLTSADV